MIESILDCTPILIGIGVVLMCLDAPYRNELVAEDNGE